eukprot:6194561-Pleurochrysis_carterae.AAC.1
MDATGLRVRDELVHPKSLTAMHRPHLARAASRETRLVKRTMPRHLAQPDARKTCFDASHLSEKQLTKPEYCSSYPRADVSDTYPKWH